MSRLLRGIGCASVVLTALGGCGAAMPGGQPDDPAMRIIVEFTDVLDLVPQAAVKVNDVTVGSVEQITLRGWTAIVRVRVDASLKLPDNATASVRQSSLLGEKFVALAAPVTEPAQGALSEGDVIPLARTRQTAEVEEVLAALGMLLNGGGLAQLKIINTEVAQALSGREADAKDALRQLDTFVANLDGQKNDIVKAIDALDRLTKQLAAQRQLIGDAVTALDPGLTVLADQRIELTGALTALNQLGRVGTNVIDRSREDLLADLRALQPLLDQLVRAGDDLPKSLDFLLTYPFPPNIVAAIVGDKVNMKVTLDLNAATVLANIVAAPALPGPVLPNLPLPSLPGLPLPSLPILPLPSAPPGLPLPSLPGLPLAPNANTSTAFPDATPIAGEAIGVRGDLHTILTGGTA